jgi:hypothetical protein
MCAEAHGLYFSVGAPAFMRGKGRFSAPEKSRLGSCALALASANPAAKADFKSKLFFARLKSSFPLLKQGAPTKILAQSFSAACSDVPQRVNKDLGFST